MSMAQPFGAFNSPNFHQVVLLNWATRTLGHAEAIGRGEGFAGVSLFVTARPSLGFCVEGRGPDISPWFRTRLHFPFNNGRASRRLAFARALASFRGEYLLGDYPGKVRLAQRLPTGPIPTFGEVLLADCSPPIEQVWRHHQQHTRYCPTPPRSA